MKVIKNLAAVTEGGGEPFDAIGNARKLSEDKKCQGSKLFENAGDIFDAISPALERGACECRASAGLCVRIVTLTL